MVCSLVQKNFHCCCCKCSLKNATFTLGFIEMIASIIQLAWCSLCLSQSEDIDHYCWFADRHLSWLLVGYRDWAGLININIALFCQAAVLMICCFLLLFGACIKKPRLMMPYLIICQLGIILLVALTIIIGVNKLLVDLVSGLGIIFGGSALTVIAFYLWLNKYSYYRKLTEKNLPSSDHARKLLLRYLQNTAV